jgi:hypothetical protein
MFGTLSNNNEIKNVLVRNTGTDGADKDLEIKSTGVSENFTDRPKSRVVVGYELAESSGVLVWRS